jgi:osmoprotectant transport system substrate-binding protein/osmoprotectant transport system permease protein
MSNQRCAIAATLCLGLCTCRGWAQEPQVVRVGSKAGIESVILGELVTHLVRHAGAEVQHRSALGGTQIVFQALVKGDLDVYPEYTGTLSAEILQGEKLRSDDDLRAALASRGLAMSKPLGFNNTYALGLKEDLADKLKVRRISDLALPEHAKLRLGLSDEFTHRGDGWPGLADAYKLPHQPKTMDHNLAYQGLLSEAIDVTDLYSTDAEIPFYKLRVLEDDRGYFPAYHCVLLYRTDLAERAPNVLRTLSRLDGAIDNAAMSEMNARVKLDHLRENQVAAEFLAAKLGLIIKMPRQPNGLITTTKAHLFLVVVSLTAAVLLAVPLGIWSYKWPKLGHAILGVVGIIQTLPSMAVLVFMVPLLGIGAWPAIVALFLYSLLPIVRGTVTGLREIPGHLKESAIVLGLPPRARLWLVELPLASRSILSGIKTAAVINVGTATVGALIGAGGYGDPILTGLRLFDIPLILQGAVPAALLALVVQGGFDLLEPLIVPRGLRLATAKS